MIENKNGTSQAGMTAETVDRLDPISQPYYPALNTIDYYTK